MGDGELIIYHDEEYYKTETSTQIILKSKNKDKYGLYSILRFTKDDTLHNESLNAVKNFFLREII